MSSEETIKIGVLSNSEEKEVYQELRVFKPISLISNLIGLECPPSKPGWRRCTSVVRRTPPYAFIAHGIFFVVVLLSKLKRYSSLDMNASMAVCLAIWMTTCLVSAAYLLRWDATGFKRRLAILISHATGQNGAKARKVMMTFRVTVHVAAFLLLVSASACFQIMAVVDVHDQHWLSGDERLRGSIIGSRYFDYLSIVLIIYGCACWCLVTSTVTLSFASVYEEFQVFNEQLNKYQIWNVEIVRKFSSTYFRLSKAVEHLDSSFSTFLFIVLSADIANFIFQMYSLLTSCCSQSIMECVFLGLIAFFMILRFLAFTLSPAKVHESAQRSAAIIAEAIDCDAVAADAELYRAVSWFLQKVTSHPAGITIGGFCIITKALLLTVVSVVVTYLILLVQMAPDSKTGIVRNGTFSQ